MRKILLAMMALLAGAQVLMAQAHLQAGQWRALLHREDGKDIVFTYQLSWQQQKPVIYVLNAGERLLVNDIVLAGDSVFIKMPFFESSFRARVYSKDSLSGMWIKAGATKTNTMPFTAT